VNKNSVQPTIAAKELIGNRNQGGKPTSTTGANVFAEMTTREVCETNMATVDDITKPGYWSRTLDKQVL
jgi:hypothetical protein